MRAQEEFLTQGGLQVLLRQLHDSMSRPKQLKQLPHWPSVRAVMGVLRNLSQRPQFQQALREADAVVAMREVTCEMVEKYLVREKGIFCSMKHMQENEFKQNARFLKLCRMLLLVQKSTHHQNH